MFVADVKCYHCSFVSGEVQVENGHVPLMTSFRSADGTSGVQLGRRPRCLRCSGPVYLDDIRWQRPPVAFDVNDRPKRGRPRRSETLKQAS
jgi:hypothetical protein